MGTENACLRASATFRVMGSHVEPEVVTEQLRLHADVSHKRGDPRSSRSGKSYSAFSEGLWAIRSQLPDTAAPEEHITFLLERLNGREQALKNLGREGCRIDIFIGLFTNNGIGGCVISTDTLKRLADLGIALDIETYCSSEAEDK